MLAEDVGRWPKTLSTDQKMLADSRNVLTDVDAELTDVDQFETVLTDTKFCWPMTEYWSIATAL